MKKLFNLLVFLSFIFLFIYLVRQDFIIPELPHPIWLIPSMLLLFAGFYISTVSWRVALSTHNLNISGRNALISHGQSIFSKYIPGKIWVILGRASYISKSKKELKNTSFISFKEQIIYTWVGFIISAIPTFIFYGIHWLSLILLAMIFIITLFLFIPPVHNLAMKSIHRIIRREFDVPVIPFRKSLPMIMATSLIWLCWTLAFYFFIRTFSEQVTPIMAFAFPLSVCFGLIAILLPGGLGLREGIIIGYLVLAGMDVETATTISFLNRLAFITGEGFIFLLALVSRLLTKPSIKSNT
ncbi:MAG: flippase-like domain-containing protein [Bacteroidales bacterium]|nr:flippase-like domain-containing protein [Bacteroidales bacterium]